MYSCNVAIWFEHHNCTVCTVFTFIQYKIILQHSTNVHRCTNKLVFIVTTVTWTCSGCLNLHLQIRTDTEHRTQNQSWRPALPARPKNTSSFGWFFVVFTLFFLNVKKWEQIEYIPLKNPNFEFILKNTSSYGWFFIVFYCILNLSITKCQNLSNILHPI